MCTRGDCTPTIDQTVQNAEGLIEETATRVPNAQIVLMGYPRTVSTTECKAANPTEPNASADHVRDKRKVMAEASKQAGKTVAFADAVPAFQGHAVCDGDFHDGDPDDRLPCVSEPGENVCLSLASFHPKDRGTTAYAQDMNQALAVAVAMSTC
ncbi:hypothetical protein [Streptomyces sp. bgisy060]|uniref:hypothetical protein n=1 Tax=Streptomyces sp. bgisy060 TaxID=3413775 RepID=UPI003EBC774F